MRDPFDWVAGDKAKAFDAYRRAIAEWESRKKRGPDQRLETVRTSLEQDRLPPLRGGARSRSATPRAKARSAVMDERSETPGF